MERVFDPVTAWLRQATVPQLITTERGQIGAMGVEGGSG